MICQLAHTEAKTASQIFNVFQAAYKIEAEMIGTDSFPPLFRSAEDIAVAKTAFYGVKVEEQLAGVIEVSLKVDVLEIDSLTVHPHFFRQGIAGKLLAFVLGELSYKHALVETAAVNDPAIKLYKKHGFSQFKQWIPEHGIEKVAFTLKKHKRKVIFKPSVPTTPPTSE